jgi:hypothetical protein
MEKKDLLDGEEIITQSDENIVTLTNFRIRYTDTQFNQAHIISIMLEKISSIEMHYASQIYYLLAGIIVSAFGIITTANHTNEYGVFAIIIGLILVGMYFSSRRYLLTISSDGGGKINFQAKGMKKETILDFVNKVEKAADKKRNQSK